MNEPTISIVIPTAGPHRRPVLATCLRALEAPLGVRMVAREQGGPRAGFAA